METKKFGDKNSLETKLIWRQKNLETKRIWRQKEFGDKMLQRGTNFMSFSQKISVQMRLVVSRFLFIGDIFGRSRH